MNVVFLDYDGVVNTPQWTRRKDGKWICSYGFPSDNAVNDVQAVQWVSEFCERYNYSIIVTSTWRSSSNYKECLRNAGLRESIKIIGKTPHLFGKSRGDEIGQWLAEHPEVDSYLIFDDDSDMGEHIVHLVKCTSSAGFREEEFREAEKLHKTEHSKAFMQLNDISKLDKNWNDNNAEPFSVDLINKCKTILYKLSHEPCVFPTACNSIQFEYEKETGEYLEFEIYDRSIKFFKIDSDKKEETGLFLTNNQIQEMINLVELFYEL